MHAHQRRYPPRHVLQDEARRRDRQGEPHRQGPGRMHMEEPPRGLHEGGLHHRILPLLVPLGNHRRLVLHQRNGYRLLQVRKRQGERRQRGDHRGRRIRRQHRIPRHRVLQGVLQPEPVLLRSGGNPRSHRYDDLQVAPHGTDQVPRLRVRQPQGHGRTHAGARPPPVRQAPARCLVRLQALREPEEGRLPRPRREEPLARHPPGRREAQRP